MQSPTFRPRRSGSPRRSLRSRQPRLPPPLLSASLPAAAGAAAREPHSPEYERGLRDGYLEAIKELKEPCIELEKYRPLDERIKASVGKSTEKPSAVSAAAPLPVPQLPVVPVVVPVEASAAPIVPLIPAAPAADVDYASKCLDKLTTNELHSALLYWIDLLTDRYRVECLEVAQAIAAELGKPRPESMEQFRQVVLDMPADELKTYLARYGVVGSNSLLDQLKRLADTQSLREIEAIDNRTILQAPPALASLPSAN